MKINFKINKSFILLILITLLFIFINYVFINKINVILITTVFYIFFLSTYIYIIYKKEIYILLNDIKIEIKSITWPNRKELNQTTITVLAIILLVSLALWLIDSSLMYIISKII